MNEFEIQVFPLKDGRWNWRKMEGDSTIEEGDPCSDRGEAIQAGREARGEEEVLITRKDGSPIGEASIGGTGRVVLMKLDGTEYGELDAPVSESSDPNQIHRMTLGPIEESVEAQELDRG